MGEKKKMRTAAWHQARLILRMTQLARDGIEENHFRRLVETGVIRIVHNESELESLKV